MNHPRQDSAHFSSTAVAGNPALSRRGALLSGAALLGSSVWVSNGLSAETNHDSFHDPDFSVIHPRAELVKHLTAKALQAQDKPRTVGGVSVTGLPESLPEFDDKIATIMNSSGVPGVSICIAHNKRLVCTRGYGKASLIGNVPVEPTMPGTLMSVSKPLTVHAALVLVREQKLHLNDLAFKILKDKPLLAAGQSADPRLDRVTIHHLMTHTSGLFNIVEDLNDPNYFQDLAGKKEITLVHGRINQEDLVRIGMREKLLFDPGQKFGYSGQGIQVLGRIVEKLSGMRLDKYIQKHIFEPLGIRSYYVGSYLADDQYRQLMKPDRSHLYALCPSNYHADQKRHTPRDIPNWGYVSWGQADACGWHSLSGLDLLRWVTFYPNTIGPALMKSVTERPWVVDDKGARVRGDMGLGWGVYELDFNGHAGKGIQHFGIWPGERCYAEYRPDGGSYCLQFNSDFPPPVDEIIDVARKFLDHLVPAGHPYLEWTDYGYPKSVSMAR